MCPNPFSGGGKTASTAAASSSNATTVNVSTPVNIDTADLADAIKALSAAQQQGARLQAIGAVANAEATVQAAQITAKGSDFWLVGGAIVALLGLAFTAGAVKLPRSLRA